MIVVSMAGIARFQDLGIQQINLKNLKKIKQNKTNAVIASEQNSDFSMSSTIDNSNRPNVIQITEKPLVVVFFYLNLF